jgi:prolyl oligopeptidase
MRKLNEAPPYSPIELVTDLLHGVAVTDPYRWLEDQDSPQTRAWLATQTNYARSYLSAIPGRGRVKERVRELLDIETYDSVQKAGSRYFFRKRVVGQEQPCIYMRDGADGKDQLLINPAEFGTGAYTAVRPLRVSPDGRHLLFEIKEGGERTGSFALLDIENRKTLPDILPRGYLRGFAFSSSGGSFYYVHEALNARRPFYRAAYRHILGTPSNEDREVFFAGEGKNIRLCLTFDLDRLGFLVYKFSEKTRTDFYLRSFEADDLPEMVIAGADYIFGPLLVPGRILAITDRDAPNLRIVELFLRKNKEPEWIDVVPEDNARISSWLVVGDRVFVSYIRKTATEILIFDFSGQKTGEIPVRDDHTVRLARGSYESDELFIEIESFTEPIGIFRYSGSLGTCRLWAKRNVAFDSAQYNHIKVSYTSRDGTRIPMLLVGRRDLLDGGCHATIMTSYGGFGASMTPQFSVFVAFLIERGCLFALPNIRGGSEFGVQWYDAAKRHNRQTAFDDFLCAAEWLIKTERTRPERLAIFGGSNAGLLVGAALTQRPDLFRAVVCMVPMLDMLRYHLFDDAHVWRDEFGTADDPDDFAVLASYSPYHRVRPGVAYPATMIVSGDADTNCNPLHARKMTARLQAASASPHPIILDYSTFRGHAAVLPLSARIEALTDRMAFLCDQLQLSA